MKYRKLGKHGIKVSAISLGGWLTYGNSVEDNVGIQCLKTAVDNGVNFIDVADVYAKGESERVLGEFLPDYERSDLVISSKVFGQMSDNPNNRGLSKKHISESIEKSLNRLNTDYLDIYFAHRFDYHTPLEETVRAFNDLIDNGSILYWGTSTWFPSEIERAYGIAKELGLRPPSVEQPRYNLLDRYIELELFSTVNYTGIGIVPWSPLAQGLLTGKYNDGIPEDSRHSKVNQLPDRELNDDVIAKLRKLTEYGKEIDLSLSQLSLAWALSREEISSLITGASKPEQVVENIVAGDITLSVEQVNEIEKIIDNEPQYHPIYNRVNYRNFKRGEI
ncbi:MAG: aldo/keto reductase family protein [Candidatus Heimdallarchaeota archaeon]|nr:aldo/keto reductase family protein [Candidatus Heimdallarchaeota archaeon]